MAGEKIKGLNNAFFSPISLLRDLALSNDLLVGWGIRLPILCCAFFLFSGTKVATHAAFVKGRFTLRVKNLLCSLRSCGIFYPSPLTNTLCFAGRCLGKKKKNVVLWRGVRFVILLPGFVRMVGDPPRSAGHAISFCNNRLAVFMV